MNCSRSSTSLKTRSAMSRSRSDSSTVLKNATASVIDSSPTSKMLWPPIVTASDAGRSRAPPHAGHGTKRM